MEIIGNLFFNPPPPKKKTWNKQSTFYKRESRRGKLKHTTEIKGGNALKENRGNERRKRKKIRLGAQIRIFSPVLKGAYLSLVVTFIAD